MIPKIIVHNTISLDGSIKNFSVDTGLHYAILQSYKPDAILVGSNTLKAVDKVPKEEPNDFIKPIKRKGPLWVFVDSKGALFGKLQVYRRFNMIRDIIVLVSKKTKKSYIKHLEERNYDYIVSGNDKVDLKKALTILRKKYKVNSVVADTGRVLSNLLIKMGLVKEISLLVSPSILGCKYCFSIFSKINNRIDLELERIRKIGNNVYLLYRLI